MNKKMIIRIVTIVVAALVVAGLAITGFKLLRKSETKEKSIEQTQEENIVVKKDEDNAVEKDEKIKENREDKKEVSVSSGLIFFNSDTREVSYQKDGKMGQTYYINKNNLSDIKNFDKEVQGLVPYKKDRRLFFADLEFNSLIEVKIKNDKLNLDLILNDEDIALGNLKEVSVVEDIMFLALEEGQIVEVNLKDNTVLKYDTDLEPAKIFKLNGELYFMDRAHLVKNEILDEELKEIKRLELGAFLSDFRIEEGNLYALSMFGRKENNSVLMKVNLSELEVKNIMSLRGIDSTFIGIEDNIAYIGQKDSIKEVNLETFEPLRAFERKHNEDVQYVDSAFYKLVGQELEKITVNNMTVEDNAKIPFNDFYVVFSDNSKIEQVVVEDKNEEKNVSQADIVDYTPDELLFRESVKSKIMEEYEARDGEELSEAELDRLTNQVMENESMWQLFYEDANDLMASY